MKMEPEGVTTIVHKLNADIENYFDELIEDGDVEIRKIHSSYEYPTEVTDQCAWPFFGIFYDYLIRREIHVLCGTQAEDTRAEILASSLYEYEENLNAGYKMDQICLENGTSISTTRKNIARLRRFVHSYEKYFKDTDGYDTIDILDDIFNTAMLHMLSYDKPTIEYDADFVNLSNVKDVLKYVKTWCLDDIEINPTIDGGFFIGDADLVFPSTITDIKVSKYHPDDKYGFDRGIYQLLFYALGLYIERGEEKRRFKVYNPLLGLVYILELPNLDFDELREMVEDELS